MWGPHSVQCLPDEYGGPSRASGILFVPQRNSGFSPPPTRSRASSGQAPIGPGRLCWPRQEQRAVTSAEYLHTLFASFSRRVQALLAVEGARRQKTSEFLARSQRGFIARKMNGVNASKKINGSHVLGGHKVFRTKWTSRGDSRARRMYWRSGRSGKREKKRKLIFIYIHMYTCIYIHKSTAVLAGLPQGRR